MRKVIALVARVCAGLKLSEWRQSAYHIRQFNKIYLKLQRMRHSTSQDEAKREAKQEQIKAAYRHYLAQAERHLDKARNTRTHLHIGCLLPSVCLQPLDEYMAHAERQIDQIRRRVLEGQVIPHHEKVFSLFQPHTEWIVKGKAGVPVELGLRVCVLEDQHRFVLHHQVMEKSTDDQVAVPMVEQTQAAFPELFSVSFDKGFHSPKNQAELKEMLDLVVLPKKGKRSKADAEREGDPRFIEQRRQHSAVESGINALEVHGLDRCLDHGIDGFKRYVALAVVARNIQRLGAVLYQQAAEAEKRKRGPYKKAA